MPRNEKTTRFCHPARVRFPGLGDRIGFRTGSSRNKQDKKIEEEQPKPQGRTGIRVNVNQIRVDVTVQNAKGDLIQGLKKENFKIYEDKVEQEIANFTSIEAPMTVVLVTEYSNAVPWSFLYDVLMASYTFVDQMRKDDWVAVMAYDMRPEILVDFTQNKMEVYNALRRLNFPAFSESNMYDTVWDVLDRVDELNSKVAVVLVASGIDTFSKKNLGETLKRVQNSNAVIYPVSTGGNFRARYEGDLAATSRLDLYQADSTLKQFAKSTGGAAFFPRFVDRIPRRSFRPSRPFCVTSIRLSYVPTNTKMDGKFRKIKVEVEADIDGDGKPDKLKANCRERLHRDRECRLGRGRAIADRHVFHDIQAEPSQADHPLGMVGHQADISKPQIAEDLGANPVVSEALRLGGLFPVPAAQFQFVLQALLPVRGVQSEIDQDSPVGLPDQLQRLSQFASRLAVAPLKDIGKHGFNLHPNEHRLPSFTDPFTKARC